MMYGWTLWVGLMLKLGKMLSLQLCTRKLLSLITFKSRTGFPTPTPEDLASPYDRRVAEVLVILDSWEMGI